MRQILTFLLLIVFSANLFSQYTNNWINYSQEYYKFPVSQNGVYRISNQTLISAGLDIYNIDHQSIQIFAKGEEIPIYIKLTSTAPYFIDFIEFYAEKNTGWFDTQMYSDVDWQANKNYSLISDTAYYFITWKYPSNGLRIEVENDTAYSNYTESPYCTVEKYHEFTSHYYSAVDNSKYTSAEGWFSSSFKRSDETAYNTKSIDLNVNSIYLNGSMPFLRYSFVGASNSSSSDYNHNVRVSFSNINKDTLFNAYEVITDTIFVSVNNLFHNSSLSFSVLSDNISVASDRNALAYCSLTYPHTYNFDDSSSYYYKIPASSDIKTFINISHFNAGNEPPIIYNLTDKKRILTSIQSGEVKAILSNPNINNDISCYITSVANIKYILNVQAVTPSKKFTDFSLNNNTDFIIISNSNLSRGATDYENYRNSSGHVAKFVNVDELYDQFSYGIKKHPLSIKNFIAYGMDVWEKQPTHLFLLGKAVHISHCRHSQSAWNTLQVPSYGNPSSDILLTSGLGGTNIEPAIATGRLSAQTEEQVTEYLNKVIEYESNPPAEWMKNILHFGGGASTNEQNILAAYLQGYESIIEDTLFGGHVTTFLKNSSLPIQITQSDSVRDLINNGSTMITFFGHAAASGFDQNIDRPESYMNVGKYPFLIANSCNAGDMFMQGANSISEDWTLIAKKGVIGFLASVGRGYAPYLNEYAKEIYKNISYKRYNKSIGSSIKNAIFALENSQTFNSTMQQTCLEFNLHGDPAIVLNSQELPDLQISISSISTFPQNISTELDSFEVQIVVTNTGKAVSSNFIIETLYTMPDETQFSLSKTEHGCYYKDTVYFKLPVDISNGSGLSNLHIKVDALDVITESVEINNIVDYSFVISSNDLMPIYPYEFSIFPKDTVTLRASSGNPFVQNESYLFQIDTVDTFNSPFLTETHIEQSGGIISWTPQITLTDSTVYYWRVAINKLDTLWKESSFIYIPKKNGWSQAHFFQFKNDEYNFIDYNRIQRKFSFIETPKELHCHNLGNPAQGYTEVQYTIDGAVMSGKGDYSCCGAPNALMIVVIDSLTLKAWPSNKGNFGQVNYPDCGRGRNDYYFVFRSNFDMLANLLDSIPSGNYILAYTWGSGLYDSWTESLFEEFEELGASQIRTKTYPYIFLAKKNVGKINEVLGLSTSSVIDLYANLTNNFNFGTIQTELIGPSTNWESLHWRRKSLGTNINDSINLSIIGVTPQGEEENVITNLSYNQMDVYDLQSAANLNQYQYLKLKYFTLDDSLRTPTQLKRWQLTYDEAPETAIEPTLGYSFHSDTVEAGDNISFSIATKNISDSDMDSLLIKYWVQDKNNNIIPIITKRVRPHPSGDVLIDSISFSSISYLGLNSLWVEINPKVSSTGLYDQLEQYHFNNIIQKYFYVESDKTNPILDVTFDGVHILDGDIVSAKPEILINLKDENRYLALDDTSLFEITLEYEKTGVQKQIYFRYNENNSQINWTPASLPNNECSILFTPLFEEDGIYNIRVGAKDKSNNESGDFNYTISFEVINKSTITNVFNYPNPFSTSTSFVFELTGSEIPDDFRIQIFTITGKLVKNIGLDDLSSIHIGRNITNYKWDGTDDFGDRLANGVYFYRVITKINTQSIEKRTTDADKFFTKNYGKMYLMR